MDVKDKMIYTTPFDWLRKHVQCSKALSSNYQKNIKEFIII